MAYLRAKGLDCADRHPSRPEDALCVDAYAGNNGKIAFAVRRPTAALGARLRLNAGEYYFYSTGRYGAVRWW